MTDRSGGAPMEFQWDNGYGQRSENSPFPKPDPNRPRGFASEPPKNSFQRAPSFGAPSFDIPKTPSKSIAHWREQHEADSTDCQTSPEAADAADDEQTPDIPTRSVKELGKNIKISRGKSQSPSKKAPSRRDSFVGSLSSLGQSFGKVGQTIIFGPGSVTFQSNDSGTLQQRSRKRSRREFIQDGLSEYDDSRPSSRDSPPKLEQQAESPTKEIGYTPAILSFIHQHPNLPAILTHWARMIMSCGLMALFLWIVYLGWQALQHDINLAIEVKASEVMRANQNCHNEYAANRCGPDAETPPALRDQCHRWRDCFNRDPMAVGRSSVTASTVAQILNDFFEPLSWKFISTMVIIAFVMFSVPYYILGVLLSKQTAPQQHAYPPPPQFPSASYMQSPYHQAQQHEAFFTPQHSRIGNVYEHEMSPSRRGRESPRRLVYS